jgi:hypothetical protein
MMQKLLYTLFFLGIIQPSTQAIDLSGVMDKTAHFGVSYIISDQLHKAGYSPLESITASLLVGYVKELSDKTIDPYDLLADTAGSLAGVYLRWEMKF